MALGVVEDGFCSVFQKAHRMANCPSLPGLRGVLRHGVFTTRQERLARARGIYLVTLTVTLPPEGYARELGKVKRDCL